MMEKGLKTRRKTGRGNYETHFIGFYNHWMHRSVSIFRRLQQSQFNSIYKLQLANSHNYQTHNALLVEPSNQRAPLFARQKIKKVINQILVFEEQGIRARGDISDFVRDRLPLAVATETLSLRSDSWPHPDGRHLHRAADSATNDNDLPRN